MRIAVTAWTSRRLGGVETYLSQVLPALAEAGHRLALFHEVDIPADGERVVPEDAVPAWSIEKIGRRKVMEELAGWKPDVIYAHGAQDFDREAGQIAPTVLFVHNYHGTCVGGMKTFRRPVITPCNRRFGLGCLLHYYPRGCGGSNPVTMLRRYVEQSRRLRAVLACDAVVTHSHHMYCEFAKHGVPLERLHRIPFYASGETQSPAERGGASLNVLGDEDPSQDRAPGAPWRLAFMGRMDRLKGGGVLLDALPGAMQRLGVPLEVTFAGDGPERAAWEMKASLLTAGRSGLQVRFTGWLSQSMIDQLLRDTDLVVVPSLWPEPFGLVGPEAGWRGVPVAAFAVGGIREWLIDGVNGSLAPGDPPTAEGLAGAIARCLSDPQRHVALRRGAVEIARRFNRRDHLRELLRVFESVRHSK